MHEKSFTLRPQNVATKHSPQPQNDAIISNKGRINFVWTVIMRLLCAVRCKAPMCVCDKWFFTQHSLKTVCFRHFACVILTSNITFTCAWFGMNVARRIVICDGIAFCSGYLTWSNGIIKWTRNTKHCAVWMRIQRWEQWCKDQMFIQKSIWKVSMSIFRSKLKATQRDST